MKRPHSKQQTLGILRVERKNVIGNPWNECEFSAAWGPAITLTAGISRNGRPGERNPFLQINIIAPIRVTCNKTDSKRRKSRAMITTFDRYESFVPIKKLRE